MSDFPPRPPVKDWADDDESDDDPEELRRQFGSPAKPKQESGEIKTGEKKDDAPVASLLSRIGGLSTDDAKSTSTSSTTPTQPPTSTSSSSSTTAPAQRPKPNTSNPLFGRALAGVKSDRAPKSAPPSTTPGEKGLEDTPKEDSKDKNESQQGKELLSGDQSESKGKMYQDLMSNDDGWGSGPQAGNNNGPDQGWNNNVPKDTQEGNSKPSGNGPDENEDKSMGGTSGLISNDFQVEVKLADLQADINNPLYSAKTFEELPLHADLKQGIYASGFKKPSKIQERALPMLLMNPPRNLIGQSQSGTGKTAAFTLDMLSRVDPSLMTPQAICLAPSRELARQIQEVVDKLAQFTEIKTFLAVPQNWKRGVKIQQHILIGTPGTILDMLSRGTSSFDPKMIRVFVLDEADEMIAQQDRGAGMGDQTLRIKRALPRNAQIVLFSATFPDKVRDFAETIAPEANQIYLKQEEVTVDAIKQLWLECDGEDGKLQGLSLLYDLMTIGQSIVFCRRKDTADQIAAQLTSEGHSVASLHAGKETGDRDVVLDTFRDGKTKVLITTNVVARGIDISQVNMVVNYDVPIHRDEYGQNAIDLESYIHRIGRTGRFGRKGCSVIFAHDDRSRGDVEEIQRMLGGKPMKKIDATSKSDIDQLEAALKAALKGPA